MTHPGRTNPLSEHPGSRILECPECRGELATGASRAHLSEMNGTYLVSASSCPFRSPSVVPDCYPPVHRLLPAGEERVVDRIDLSENCSLTPDDVREIFGLLREKQVVVIQAPTGVGKSTLLPYYFAWHPEHMLERTNGRIIVTQPRRVAAEQTTERIAQGHGTIPGLTSDVGVRHQQMRASDDGNLLTQSTDGSVLNTIVNTGLDDVRLLMIDEAHERSAVIDVILALVKQNLHLYPFLKVVISSATIDPELYVNYFGKTCATKYIFDERETEPNKTYKVNYQGCTQSEPDGNVPVWHGRDEPCGCRPESAPGDPQVKYYRPDAQKVIRLARNRVDDVVSWMEANEVEARRNDLYGDILVFVPTVSAIKNLVLDLRTKHPEFEVLPFHARVDPDTRRTILDEPDDPSSPRRIIVATNIAETSLTLSNLRHVVDVGMQTGSDGKASLHHRSGLRQRWGRVGRKSPGRVWTTYTWHEFMMAPEYASTELVEEAVDPLIYLKLVAGGLAGDFAERDDVVGGVLLVDANKPYMKDGHENFDPNSRLRANVSAVLERLKERGCLEERAARTGTIVIPTVKGMLAAEMDVEPEFADLIRRAEEQGCAVEAAVLVSRLKWLATSRRTESSLHLRNIDDVTRGSTRGLGFNDELDAAIGEHFIWQGLREDERDDWCGRCDVDPKQMKEEAGSQATILRVLRRRVPDGRNRPLDPTLVPRLRRVMSEWLPQKGKAGQPQKGSSKKGSKVDGTVLVPATFTVPATKQSGPQPLVGLRVGIHGGFTKDRHTRGPHESRTVAAATPSAAEVIEAIPAVLTPIGSRWRIRRDTADPTQWRLVEQTENSRMSAPPLHPLGFPSETVADDENSRAIAVVAPPPGCFHVTGPIGLDELPTPYIDEVLNAADLSSIAVQVAETGASDTVQVLGIESGVVRVGPPPLSTENWLELCGATGSSVLTGRVEKCHFIREKYQVNKKADPGFFNVRGLRVRVTHVDGRELQKAQRRVLAIDRRQMTLLSDEVLGLDGVKGPARLGSGFDLNHGEWIRANSTVNFRLVRVGEDFLPTFLTQVPDLSGRTETVQVFPNDRSKSGYSWILVTKQEHWTGLTFPGFPFPVAGDLLLTKEQREHLDAATAPSKDTGDSPAVVIHATVIIGASMLETPYVSPETINLLRDVGGLTSVDQQLWSGAVPIPHHVYIRLMEGASSNRIREEIDRVFRDSQMVSAVPVDAPADWLRVTEREKPPRK